MAEGYRSFSKHAIWTEWKLGYVFFVWKDFAYSFCASWPNEILRKHEFSKGTLVCDCFANGDAAVTHNLIISQIQNKQIPLILQAFCKLFGAIFKNHAVAQMQISQSFIILNTFAEGFGSLNPNNIPIQKKFRQKFFILKALRKLRNAAFADIHVLKCDNS